MALATRLPLPPPRRGIARLTRHRAATAAGGHFVNGCFWHGHERCATFRLPASNQEFWRQKIDNNRQRDARNAAWLRRMGWHVFTVWECQLTPARRQRTLLGLSQRLSTLTLAAYHTVAAPYPEVELTATPLAAEGTRS